MMSDGSRSGVNWMRVNRASSAAASVRAISVFAVPGTPSRSTWPPQRTAMYRPSITWSWPTTARPMVSWSARRNAAASLWVATGGIVPCALTLSANRLARPPALAGVDVAREPQQLALFRSPRRERTSVAEQRRERTSRLRVGQRYGRAEAGVVKVPIDARRLADRSFELVRVASRDRSALTAARIELSHRGDIRGRAGYRGLATVRHRLAEAAAIQRDCEQHDDADDERRQPDRPIEDRPGATGCGSLAV